MNDITTIKERGNIIAKTAAGLLKDKCQFLKTITKEPTENTLKGKNGYKSGDTIGVNKPARFLIHNSADITGQIQGVVEEEVKLVLDQRSVVPVSLESAEIATDLGLKSWLKRILEPAMVTISNDIEAKALVKAAAETYNFLSPQSPTKFDTDYILQAGELMDISACPDFDNRFVLLDPTANRSAVNERKGLFQSSEKIKKQYESGAMGIADGFTFLRNNLLPAFQNGNDVTGVEVDAAPAEGGSLLPVTGLTLTTGTVKRGQVFTIAGVNRVHPVTKAVLPELQQFVVMEDATADGAGEAVLSVSPSFFSAASGAKQNVAALPAGGGALVFGGAANQIMKSNMAYHKDAFRFASVKLMEPKGVDMVAQQTVDDITVRIVRDFDVMKDELVTRLDVLWGLVPVRPEWAVRLLN